MLKKGDLAPAFETTDCSGERLVLSELLKVSRVVLFFFPRAFSPACTVEVRHFRDSYARLKTLGAELVGVSVDRFERNCAFSRAERLTFRLVSDEARVISSAYGVVWPVLKIDRRATFVIGTNGVIEDVFHHEIQVGKHLEDVLERLLQT